MTDGRESKNHPYLAPDEGAGLLWGPLTEGRLIRRYKRFLADVELADGRLVTAHTPNTGRMSGCAEPGRRVWLSLHEGRGRKYDYTWELIEMPGTLVGVNTNVPNKLVLRAVEGGAAPGLPFPCRVRPEVKWGASRLDLMVTAPDSPDIYIEIKNCTLVEGGAAYFPDAVSQRGAKHLEELAGLAELGHRAIIFILTQRSDGFFFSPADHIDPHWGAALRRALASGVELMVFQADLDLRGIRLGRKLPVRL